MISLSCYYPAEKPRFFTIHVDQQERVDVLRTEVKANLLTRFKIDIDEDDIQLFKADIPVPPLDDLPMRALQWLHRQKESDCLVDVARLSSIFPGGPSASNVVHIIVSDPEVLEMTRHLADLPSFLQRRKLRKDLHTLMQSFRPASSPSETIGSVNNIRDFLDRRVYLGRPAGAPAAIFNPALAALQCRLENLDKVEVTPQDVVHAIDYLNAAMQIYDDEKARKDAIQNSIDVALKRYGEWNTTLEWADRIKPNCTWWHEIFLLMVLELKNTVGLDGNPVLQAIVDYCKVVSQEKYKNYLDLCNFPIVLVGITENRIDISIAVCIGEIHVTHLLTLDLTAGFLASDNIIRLARVFKALSFCLADLSLYYSKVEDKTVPSSSSLYPNPTPADSSVTLPVLHYTHLLSRDGQPIAVTEGLGITIAARYIATLADQEVVVKFTARYNEQAHRLLAEVGFAPKLHFCKRVVGGLYMVVMDRVCGKSLWQLQYDEEPIPTDVLGQVREAVHLLHENGIVFGDLRDGNILYDTSKAGAVLVDFDWAGMHGVNKYPPTLNVANNWPPDVVPYGPMLKDHDLWQLTQLQGLCNTAV